MREKILIDTFPLVELLYRKIIDDFPQWSYRLRRRIEILKGPDEVKSFLRFLAKSEVYITPQTIAEVERHQRKDLPSVNQHKKFWRVFYELSSLVGFIEVHKELATIELSIVEEFGAADAVVVSIAIEQKMCVVLNDQRLESYCRQEKVKYKNFWDFAIP